MTTIHRIIGFHNCDGCSRKVRIALRRIGVKLVEFDRERGNVTIETADINPEVIRYELERKIKKSVVVLQSQELVHANQNQNPNPNQNQNPNSIVSLQVLPANQTIDLQGLSQAMLRMAQLYGGVEITNWNTIRINFIDRKASSLVARPHTRGNMGVQGIDHADVEYAPTRLQPRLPPQVVVEPSAPPMPMAEQAVYGYPPEFYGFSTTRSHDHGNGRCNIV